MCWFARVYDHSSISTPLDGPVIISLCFTGPLDLSQLTSPYQGSTTNAPNNLALSCGGSGNEQGFFYLLQPGETIEIGQSTNNYDSRHELSVGGAYPGDTSVVCRDDPDTTRYGFMSGKMPVKYIPNFFLIFRCHQYGYKVDPRMYFFQEKMHAI